MVYRGRGDYVSPMRTTAGKSAQDRILLGNPELSEKLAVALEASAEIDRGTHGFHTWPAGLHPDAAAEIVRLVPGDSVLDPFCGGGTVLVEARIAGKRAVGRDLSQIATRIARVRTATPDEATLTAMRSAARRMTDVAREATDLPPESILPTIKEWYAKHAAIELESLRRQIAEADPSVRWMLEVVFSSILVKVSWRKSDTSSRRETHDRPPGTTAILFHKKARELGRRMAALRALVPEGTPESDVLQGDARNIRLSRPVDAVVTSPPYPSTYDYLPLQHLRRVWLGLEEADDSEIGSRRLWRAGDRDARKQWRADTNAWTASAAANLRPGGHLAIVIGDGLTPAGTVDTSEATEDAAKAAGLVSVARASVLRPDFAREAARWEHAFLFQAGK